MALPQFGLGMTDYLSQFQGMPQQAGLGQPDFLAPIFSKKKKQAAIAPENVPQPEMPMADVEALGAGPAPQVPSRWQNNLSIQADEWFPTTAAQTAGMTQDEVQAMKRAEAKKLRWGLAGSIGDNSQSVAGLLENAQRGFGQRLGSGQEAADYARKQREEIERKNQLEGAMRYGNTPMLQEAPGTQPGQIGELTRQPNSPQDKLRLSAEYLMQHDPQQMQAAAGLMNMSNAFAPKEMPRRTTHKGNMEVTEELQPDGSWKEVARAPRWQPDQNQGAPPVTNTAGGAFYWDPKTKTHKLIPGSEPQGANGRPIPVGIANDLKGNAQVVGMIDLLIAPRGDLPPLLDTPAGKRATGVKNSAIQFLTPDAFVDNIKNFVDPQGVDTRAIVTNLNSYVVKERSGAAVTIAEFARQRGFLPTDADSNAMLKSKLARLKEALINENQYIADFAESQGYRAPPLSNRKPGGLGDIRGPNGMQVLPGTQGGTNVDSYYDQP